MLTPAVCGHARAVSLLCCIHGRALTPPPASSVFTASSNAACWSGGSPPDPRPLTPCKASRIAASAACASTLLLLRAATMPMPRCLLAPADSRWRCVGASCCLCMNALNGARLLVRRAVSCNRACCCSCAVASISRLCTMIAKLMHLWQCVSWCTGQDAQSGILCRTNAGCHCYSLVEHQHTHAKNT